MKILEWNIQGGASFGWSGKKIDAKLSSEVFNHDADVVVLTEFVIIRGLDFLFEKFDENEYIYFISCCSGKNGVLIAIKKELVNLNAFMTAVYTNNLISSHTEGCNYLKVELPLNTGENLVIIGCRMETGHNKNLKAQYDFERVCFDEILIPAIGPLKEDYKYIIAGDFNNAACYGNLNKPYNPENYTNSDGSQKYQYNYNLNIIKDEFETIGFEMVDKTHDGKYIGTWSKKSNTRNKIPNDHIFVKGFSLTGECKPIPTDKSDHYILLAKVE